MKTLTSLVCALCLAVSFLLSAPLLGTPSVALAQDWSQQTPGAIIMPGQNNGVTRRDGGGGGLFRLFRFGSQRQTRQPASAVPPATVGGGQGVVNSAPVVVLPPPKDPDAIAVVTFGDEFADQLREGLVERFTGDRLIEAVGVSRPGSGLTQTEDFNWNVEAIQRLDEYTQVGAVVVALGYSDRQALIDGERRFGFASESWRDAYRNRVTSFALTLLTEGYPAIFVGLPPMADPQLNADIRLINQLIEEAVAPTRARFVEIYDGFTDVQGNYVRAGPTMAGEVANLRTSDGIFFNRAGREKFAHFVERFIPREGREEPEPEVSAVVFEGSTQSQDGVGPVLLLTSGFADPTASLVGDVTDVLPQEPETRERLLRGASTLPPVGRADAFALPAQPEG